RRLCGGWSGGEGGRTAIHRSGLRSPARMLTPSLSRLSFARECRRRDQTERMPRVLEGARDDLPLATMVAEGIPAGWRDAVVPAAPATGRRIPPRLDVAKPVEPV